MKKILKIFLTVVIALSFCIDGYAHPHRFHRHPPRRPAPVRVVPPPKRKPVVRYSYRRPILPVRPRSSYSSGSTILWHSPNLALDYARKTVREYLPNPDIFKETGYNVVFDDQSKAYITDYYFECADAYGEIQNYHIQMLIQVRVRTPNTILYDLLDIKDMSY